MPASVSENAKACAPGHTPVLSKLAFSRFHAMIELSDGGKLIISVPELML